MLDVAGPLAVRWAPGYSVDFCPAVGGFAEDAELEGLGGLVRVFFFFFPTLLRCNGCGGYGYTYHVVTGNAICADDDGSEALYVVWEDGEAVVDAFRADALDF